MAYNWQVWEVVTGKPVVLAKGEAVCKVLADWLAMEAWFRLNKPNSFLEVVKDETGSKCEEAETADGAGNEVQDRTRDGGAVIQP